MVPPKFDGAGEIVVFDKKEETELFFGGEIGGFFQFLVKECGIFEAVFLLNFGEIQAHDIGAHFGFGNGDEIVVVKIILGGVRIASEVFLENVINFEDVKPRFFEAVAEAGGIVMIIVKIFVVADDFFAMVEVFKIEK